jgi:hypothetical protein
MINLGRRGRKFLKILLRIKSFKNLLKVGNKRFSYNSLFFFEKIFKKLKTREFLKLFKVFHFKTFLRKTP